MNSKISEESFIIRYGFATLLVFLALILTLLIWLFINSFASPLFLLAIVIVAWKYGIRVGVYATIISGICINYFFMLPAYQLSGSWDDVSRLLIFAVQGYALCWLITCRTNVAEEVRESRGQLQSLLLHQNTLREEERKKVALEIHDELGQALTTLKMEVHILNQEIKLIDSQTDSVLIQRAEDLSHLIDTTIQSVRRIATELRPPILDDLGLVAAIEWQSQEFQRRTGITCFLSTNIENVDINGEFSTAIFRIFQETLTNITRHAEANTITVNFKKLHQKLILRVEDDGKGIHIENINLNHSLGILGMRERARIIGGELEVFNGEENGTVVLLTAPLI